MSLAMAGAQISERHLCGWVPVHAPFRKSEGDRPHGAREACRSRRAAAQLLAQLQDVTHRGRGAEHHEQCCALHTLRALQRKVLRC